MLLKSKTNTSTFNLNSIKPFNFVFYLSHVFKSEFKLPLVWILYLHTRVFRLKNLSFN